jgi:hypothetical protein
LDLGRGAAPKINVKVHAAAVFLWSGLLPLTRH